MAYFWSKNGKNFIFWPKEGYNFAKKQKIKNLNLPFVENHIILVWTDFWP